MHVVPAERGRRAVADVGLGGTRMLPPQRDIGHSVTAPVWWWWWAYKSDVDAESILIIFKVSPNGSSDILKENQKRNSKSMRLN